MGIELLDLGRHATIQSLNELGYHQQCGEHLVAYSVNGTHVATAWQGGSVIKVLDTLGKTPQCQLFDVNMPILDIKITNNTIFAVGGDEVVRQHLEAGGIVRSSHSAMRRIPDDAPIQFNTLSSDCSQIAIAHTYGASLYDVQTQTLCSQMVDECVFDTKFSPDGLQLWLLCSNNMGGSFIKLEWGRDGNVTRKDLNDEWSWVNLFSPHGWHVGGNSEWIADSGGNKLLWLPLSWRTKQWQDVKWDGDFLAFVGSYHPEPIIIKFKPPTSSPITGTT